MRYSLRVGVISLLLLLIASYLGGWLTSRADQHNRAAKFSAACQPLNSSLQQIADRAIGQGLPGVAIAVYTPSCGTLAVASGQEQLTPAMTMPPGDHFRIASCSKPFIGVLVMQLVEAGQISLSDPIANYLSAEAAHRIKNANRATLRQLMNHTSGIYDYFTDDFIAESSKHPGKYYSLAEALKFAYDQPAEFSPPGSKYSYSNTDTVLLAVMLEKVTHKPFTQLLRDRIFNPLNLTNTYNDYAEPAIAPLAHGYQLRNQKRPLDYTDINQGYGLPDGGIVSTSSDLVTFIRALLHENRLMKPATLAQMLTVDPVAAADQEALNIFIYANYDRAAGPLIGHSGEINGYRTEMYYYPKKDIAIVMMTNSTGGNTGKLWTRLFDNVSEKVLAN